MQRGFVPAIALIAGLIIAAIAFGVYYVGVQNNRSQPATQLSPSPSSTPISTPSPSPTHTPTPTPKPTPSLTTCPTPPTCSGNLVYGDPGPDDPNQCPRYQCL